MYVLQVLQPNRHKYKSMLQKHVFSIFTRENPREKFFFSRVNYKYVQIVKFKKSCQKNNFGPLHTLYMVILTLKNRFFENLRAKFFFRAIEHKKLFLWCTRFVWITHIPISVKKKMFYDPRPHELIHPSRYIYIEYHENPSRNKGTKKWKLKKNHK